MNTADASLRPIESASSRYGGYCDRLQSVMRQVDPESLESVCRLIHEAYTQGRQLFVCGNGGSAATASHFAADFAKVMYTHDSSRHVFVTAMTDSSPAVTALANDEGYKMIFEYQLRMRASKGDTLMCISCSGCSPNVVRASQWANGHGMQTIAFTGFDGGWLGRIVAQNVHIKCEEMGLIEGAHALLLDYVSREVLARCG